MGVDHGQAIGRAIFGITEGPSVAEMNRPIMNAVHARLLGSRALYHAKHASRPTFIDFYTRYLGFTMRSAHLPAFADVTRGSLRLLLSGPQRGGQRSWWSSGFDRRPPGDLVELFTRHGIADVT
ncbi:hypothetical protein MHPYR_190022 [uncultured Mycobacterium sp.]|uniref:Uncharacterized protein n=1 Tax=uncultured Mycobacterium sp. TaxID=171292 RepID=A0A1Y5PDV2_9MYCO|nr:hypothetical protein MHPYR_190022 [uncultured Mycobacterium sp.]